MSASTEPDLEQLAGAFERLSKAIWELWNTVDQDTVVVHPGPILIQAKVAIGPVLRELENVTELLAKMLHRP